MKKLYLYLCSERTNSTFATQIRNGIEVIQTQVRKANSLKKDSFTYLVKSASIKSDENDDLNGSEIVEYVYDLENYDAELKSLCHLEKTQDPSVDEEFKANDFLKLSEYLHNLADSQCSFGEISLCILWCIEKYIPCLSDVVEFYAALLRIQSWHNGIINIITSSFNITDEWRSFLPFHVSHCSSEVVEFDLSVSWRGSLSFSVQGKKGPVLYPGVTLTSLCGPNNIFHSQGNKEINDSQFILPVCEVFSDVEIGSIPWVFIQKGSLCKLQPSTAIHEEQRSDIMRIFKTFIAHQDVGTLIRIRHSSLPPTMEGVASTNTQEWKQVMAEGNFHAAPTYHFRGYHHSLVLLILPACATENYVYCVALQDYGEDIVKLVMQESLKQKPENKNQKEKVMNLIMDTGEISNLEIAAFSRLILNLPKLIANKLTKTGQKVENLWDETKLAMERAASKKIESFLFSHLRPLDLLTNKQEFPSELLAGKTSWPEYQALEEAEKASRKYLPRFTSGDFLGGLPPPISSDAIVTIDASQLCKYFQSNGEAIEPFSKNGFDQVPSFTNARKSSYSSYSVEGVKMLGWSDSLHIRHHGIYYNCNCEQEKFEFSCNRWCERHVRNETASTCTLFQDKENNTLINNRKKPKNSLRTTPAESNLTSLRQTSKALLESDAVSTKSGSSFAAKDLRRSPRKLHVGMERILRRSPRKRKRDDEVSMKPSDLLKPELGHQARKLGTIAEKRPPKPAHLTDVHKQKLRNVILSSLEAQGINVKDALFKLCFKKMFIVCQPFALDVIGQGSTTKNFENIAKSHVKQVVQFEKQKLKMRPR